MSGRPRKPTALLKLEGGFRSDRHRDRENEPAPHGKPIKPEFRSSRASDLWDSLSQKLAPVLTSWDETALTGLCRWYEQFCWAMDRLEDNPGDERYKLTILAATCWKQCESLMRTLGLTPADRSRIQVSKDDEAIAKVQKYLA